MFVGHFGVGKTTLVHKVFCQGSKAISSTNGIDVYLGKCYYNKTAQKWYIQDKHSEFVLGVDDIIQIDFWDFAGQLIFYTTHQTYMSRRCLYFLVFDLSMGLHGEELDEDLDPIDKKHIQVIDFLEFWIGSIRLYARGEKKGFPKIIIIGTHKDKIQSESELQSIKSEICERFRHMLESGQLVIREDLFVNALEMSEDQIETIREVMLEYGQQYPEFGETIPASWMDLHRSLYDLKRQGKKVVSREEVDKMNEVSDNPLQKEELELFLLYLHSIGYLLYFSDTELRDNVILDTKWIIEAMKCIFTCEQFLYRLWDRGEWKEMRETGKVRKSHIEKVWRRQGKSPLYKYRRHLLLVMEKLDLVCKPKIYDDRGNVVDSTFYYIPAMISASVPEELRQILFLDAVSMSYIFEDIIPPALFNRLISSCLCLWQVHHGHVYNGLVILRSGRFHLLQFQREYREITVTIMHTEQEIVDVNLCRAVKRFVCQTIHRILATYSISSSADKSEIYSMRLSRAAVSMGLLGNEESCMDTNDSECPEDCIGLTDEEMKITVNDKILMRFSLLVTAEDKLMQLSAHLLGSVKFLEDTKRDFQELRHADFAFLIFHEWKTRRLHQGAKPTARDLLTLIQLAEIDGHFLCTALRRADKEAFQLSPVFQLKEPSPELLDAVADRLSNTYFHVGIELEFHLEEIRRIRMNNRSNTLEILRELLHSWLEKNKPRSKATIAWLATALLNSQSNIERLIELEDISIPTSGKEGKTKCNVMSDFASRTVFVPN